METVATINNSIILIDEEDLHFLDQYNWKAEKDGYICITQKIQLHSLINNTPKHLVTDHINGVKTDNRRCNLRSVTIAQNNMNRPTKAISGSNVGVSHDIYYNKWIAYIDIAGKRINIGRYNSFTEAQAVRKEAEVKYYGEYIYNPSKVPSFDPNTHMEVDIKGTKILIDKQDEYLTKNEKWKPDPRKYIVYTRRLILHTLINNTPDNMITEHINKDKSDYRRCNLRSSTQSRSELGRLPQVNNTSGCKGISWQVKKQLWIAYITINGKRITLKRSKDKEVVIAARKQAELQYLENKII